jgi:outer membrane receptor for monomeric catechols
MRGWYVEVAYDVLPLFLESNATLEPYFRYENFDTQRKVSNGNSRVEGVNEGRFEKDQSKNVDLYVAGIQYKPIPQVVFKLDYRHFDPRQGHRANEVQALVGYVF